jgi:hypothetical protein
MESRISHPEPRLTKVDTLHIKTRKLGASSQEASSHGLFIRLLDLIPGVSTYLCHVTDDIFDITVTKSFFLEVRVGWDVSCELT